MRQIARLHDGVPKQLYQFTRSIGPVSGQEPALVTPDEIERCYYEQGRHHLAGYQGSWLPRKALCKTHRNKSAWIDCEEQAELARSTKTHCDLCLSQRCL